MSEDLPTATELEAFYFAAHQQGYASNREPAVSGGLLPGAKYATYDSGRLQFIDFWFSGLPFADGKRWSFGFTVIFCRLKPIWIMWYHGWWQSRVEGVTAFLKRALSQAATFIGGRGPKVWVEGDLVYQNFPDDDLDIVEPFSGTDQITRRTDSGSEKLYVHSYGGMPLADLSRRVPPFSRS